MCKWMAIPDEQTQRVLFPCCECDSELRTPFPRVPRMLGSEDAPPGVPGMLGSEDAPLGVPGMPGSEDAPVAGYE